MKSHLDYVCRIAAGLDPAIDRTKVRVIDGRSKPQVQGQPARTVNPEGETINHTNAYRKAGGRTRHEASTRRIEVGAGWLASLIQQAQAEYDGWLNRPNRAAVKPIKTQRASSVVYEEPHMVPCAPMTVSPTAFEPDESRDTDLTPGPLSFAD